MGLNKGLYGLTSDTPDNNGTACVTQQEVLAPVTKKSYFHSAELGSNIPIPFSPVSSRLIVNTVSIVLIAVSRLLSIVFVRYSEYVKHVLLHYFSVS
jgi:hypothetical protein